ncbi:protein kinase domain-containing protein [Yinghuangia sp. YIM S09857]|uniref:serine/threonine-protein kinase n=1 Tax=Yinghuangia sp. YIM S09857 TaxID=3436929 RepID=UPI003F53750C
MRPLTAEDPDRIGAFRLAAVLGEGGMGRVYLAHSPDGVAAAVKRIRGGVADDPDFRARFRREVEAVRAVRGRFTAALLDAGPDDELPWMATEYVPGPPLDAAVREHGPFPASAVLVLAEGLARALVAIHGAGLVHRDLKPSNVLLTADGPQVIDFGISRAAGATTLTWTGQLVGSAGYMAPEQIRGERVGIPGDVFSLGATLVFAARGTGPFGRAEAMETLIMRTLTEDPDLTGVPADVAALANACLAKDPRQRPDPRRVLDDLAGRVPTAPTATGWLPEEVGTTLDRYTAPPVPEAATWTARRRLSDGSGSGTGPESPSDDSATGGNGNADTARPTEPAHSRRRFLWALGAAALTAGAGIAAVPLVRALGSDDSPAAGTPDGSTPAGPSAPRHPGVPREQPRWSHTGLATEPQCGRLVVFDPDDIEGTRSTHFVVPGVGGDRMTRRVAAVAVRLNDGAVAWRADFPASQATPTALGPLLDSPPEAPGDLLHLGLPMVTIDTRTAAVQTAALPYEAAKLPRTGPVRTAPGTEFAVANQQAGHTDTVLAVHATASASTLVFYEPIADQGWAYGPGRRLNQPRALHDSELVFLADSAAQPVYAVSTDTGKPVWTADLGGPQNGAGIVNALLRAYFRESEDSTLLVAADRVYALGASTGDVRWASEPTSGYTALTVMDDLVFAAAENGLTAWQLGTGKLVWNHAPDTPTVPALAAAAVWDGRIWFANGSAPHELYGLQPGGGRLDRLIEPPAAATPGAGPAEDARPGWKLHSTGANFMAAAYGHVVMGFQGLTVDADGAPLDPHPRDAV